MGGLRRYLTWEQTLASSPADSMFPGSSHLHHLTRRVGSAELPLYYGEVIGFVSLTNADFVWAASGKSRPSPTFSRSNTLYISSVVAHVFDEPSQTTHTTEIR
jgi:hypothetical protein